MLLQKRRRYNIHINLWQRKTLFINTYVELNLLEVVAIKPFQSQRSLYWTTIQNFNFSLRRDRKKNFL